MCGGNASSYAAPKALTTVGVDAFVHPGECQMTHAFIGAKVL